LTYIVGQSSQVDRGRAIESFDQIFLSIFLWSDNIDASVNMNVETEATKRERVEENKGLHDQIAMLNRELELDSQISILPLTNNLSAVLNDCRK
jgi:hypothetical protein